MASSKHSVNDHVQASLLWQSLHHTEVEVMVRRALDDLLVDGLIQETAWEDCYEPAKLGLVVVAFALSPEDGVFIHSELSRNLESFVMVGEMHIFYLFTPVQTSGLAHVSWPVFRAQLESLTDSGMRAIRLAGVNPAFVNRLVNSGGELKETTTEEVRIANLPRSLLSFPIARSM
jgi:hypothetical protein